LPAQSIALCLNRRGKKLREQLLNGRLAAIGPLLALLSAAQEATFAALLHKLVSAMDTSDLERRTLWRQCDDRFCFNCPIPDTKPTTPADAKS
jgi:hypothetical protein